MAEIVPLDIHLLPQGFQKDIHPVKYKPFLSSFSGQRQEGNKMLTEIQHT